MSSAIPAPAGANRALLVVVFCCLAAVGEGFDLQTPGVTMPVLAPLFHLTTGQGFIGGFFSSKALFASMSTFGLMVGAVIGGRASDLVGRKWVTVISVALFAAFSAATAQATSADMLLGARFCTGLGLGGALPNLLAIVTENVSPGRRNTALGALYACIPGGGALAGLSSYAFADPSRWQMIYYLGALAPLIALPGLIFGVPNFKPLEKRKEAKPSVAFALFGEGRTRITLVLWLSFLFSLITSYVLLSWLPSLLIAKGLPRPQASIVQIGFSVLGVVFSGITGIMVDRPSRATTIALVFLSGIVVTAILAAAPAPASFGLSLVLGSLAGGTIAAAQSIVYALAPGAYPVHVRGTGVGFAVAAGRFGAALGPLLAGAILGAGAGAATVLGVLVPLVILAGLCALYVNRVTRPAGVLVLQPEAVSA
jgi:AAHS family 3-hydroxyphenylpropionic acid transporter